MGLRDWTEIKDPTVSNEEATTILNVVNTESIPKGGHVFILHKQDGKVL